MGTTPPASKDGWTHGIPEGKRREVPRPLADEDKHFLQSLGIPATNEQKDFNKVILGLTKVLINSLNEKRLSAFIPSAGALPAYFGRPITCGKRLRGMSR